MEIEPNPELIIKNFALFFQAFAEGHFKEVFMNEFFFDSVTKSILLEKGRLARQKQGLLLDVTFGHAGLSQIWRERLVRLLTCTGAFWREVRTAVEESDGDKEIGVQHPSKKAAAQIHLGEIGASLSELCGSGQNSSTRADDKESHK